MRKIDKSAALSLLNHKPMSGANTVVTVSKTADGESISQMYLFGNLIASHYFGVLELTCAGHATDGEATATTKSRLNALCCIAGLGGFYHSKKQLYFDDVAISASDVFVKAVQYHDNWEAPVWA